MDPLIVPGCRTKRRWLTVIAGIVAAAALSAPVTATIDPDELDDVVDDAVTSLGAGEAGDELRIRLREQLQLAVRFAAVDESEIAGLGYRDTADSVTPSTDRDRDQIRERLQDRLRDHIDEWAVIAPEWRRAMEQLRDHVRDCLAEPTETCLEQNRLEMQYRHAEEVQAAFTQRVAAANGDPVRLQELERQRERAQLRLEAMLRSDDADMLNDVGIPTRDMEQLRSRLEDQARSQTRATTGSTTMSTITSSSTTQQRQGQP